MQVLLPSSFFRLLASPQILPLLASVSAQKRVVSSEVVPPKFTAVLALNYYCFLWMLVFFHHCKLPSEYLRNNEASLEDHSSQSECLLIFSSWLQRCPLALLCKHTRTPALCTSSASQNMKGHLWKPSSCRLEALGVSKTCLCLSLTLHSLFRIGSDSIYLLKVLSLDQ